MQNARGNILYEMVATLFMCKRIRAEYDANINKRFVPEIC